MPASERTLTPKLWDELWAEIERIKQKAASVTANMTETTPVNSSSPFVGHKLFIWNSPTHPVRIDGPVECLDHSGSHLFVKDPSGNTAWINLNVIPSIEFRDDQATVSPPGVDDAQVADALAAFKARPGPLTDTGA